MKSIEIPIYFPLFISPKITKSSKLKPIIGTWRNIIYLMETHQAHTHSHLSTHMEKILDFLCYAIHHFNHLLKRYFYFVYLNQLECQLCLSSHFFIIVWSEKKNSLAACMKYYRWIPTIYNHIHYSLFTMQNAKKKKVFQSQKRWME